MCGDPGNLQAADRTVGAPRPNVKKILLTAMEGAASVRARPMVRLRADHAIDE